MLEKAWRASNLLSLVDGSRRPPDVTEINSSGYTAEAIRPMIKADGSGSLTVVAEDDYYKYYADSIVAYTFMLSMINKDIIQHLGVLILDGISQQMVQQVSWMLDCLTVMISPIEIPFNMESSVIFNTVAIFFPSKLTLLV